MGGNGKEMVRRRHGRPRGTGYRGIDAQIHALMRQRLQDGLDPSLTKAAEAVVHLAYGFGTRESKITRLVRTYPWEKFAPF